MSVGGALTSAGEIYGNGTITGAGSLTVTSPGIVSPVSGTLDLSTIAVTNLSSGTLTGGSWYANSGGVLKLPGNIVTNSATLQLVGGQILNASGTSALVESLGSCPAMAPRRIPQSSTVRPNGPG